MKPPTLAASSRKPRTETFLEERPRNSQVSLPWALILLTHVPFSLDQIREFVEPVDPLEPVELAVQTVFSP